MTANQTQLEMPGVSAEVDARPTLHDRAAWYAAAFPQWPDSHFMASPRWMTATWVTGNNYRGSGFYGSYPPGYLRRVHSLFPDVHDVLHLFSGSLSAEDVEHRQAGVVRLDLNPRYEPDVVADAESTGFPDGAFDLIMADPPYSVEDAEHYGRPLCNKRKVLIECHRILRPGGSLLWMDQSQPMYRKTDWRLYGLVSIYRSTNHRIRGVFFYERLHEHDENKV